MVIKISMYNLVCGNTMCVSTCWVTYVLAKTCLDLYSTSAEQIMGTHYYCRVDFRNSQDFSVLKKNRPAFCRKSVWITFFALVERGDFSLFNFTPANSDVLEHLEHHAP